MAKQNGLRFFSCVSLLVSFVNVSAQQTEKVFWEGPHPEDISKMFYVYIDQQSTPISAIGFWTDNGFYDSQFKVDSLHYDSISLRFYVPSWNCFYTGQLINDSTIEGGFSCLNEPFDKVNLFKNNSVTNALTEARPGSETVGYQYRYMPPKLQMDDIPVPISCTSNDSSFMNKLIPEIIQGKYGRLNSFLLLKNDTLIGEEYFYNYSANDLHQIESATKSITSLLVGIAYDMELIKDLRQPIKDIFPNDQMLRQPGYREMTIENLLTMTSGYSNEYQPMMQEDRIEFSLHRQLVKAPGKKFIYDGGNTELLGAILKIKTGFFADAFAEQYLFHPLGIKTFNWEKFRQNGFPCMGGSLWMRPRDMAKIGLLVLENGKYDGQQIISADWIHRSTKVQVETHISTDAYAYHWWVVQLYSGSKKYETIWANGLGSQFIYIIPGLHVVIVTTGYNYENDSWAITEGISKYLHLLDE